MKKLLHALTRFAIDAIVAITAVMITISITYGYGQIMDINTAQIFGVITSIIIAIIAWYINERIQNHKEN